MQKHPLLTVKEAAEILRLDERSVRERLVNGQLKGEKKSVGLREKWFVYHGSVEAARAKEDWQSDGDDSLTDSGVVEGSIVDAEQTDFTARRSDGDWLDTNRDKLKVLAEELVKPLLERIENQAELIHEQKRQLELIKSVNGVANLASEPLVAFRHALERLTAFMDWPSPGTGQHPDRPVFVHPGVLSVAAVGLAIRSLAIELAERFRSSAQHRATHRCGMGSHG